MPLHTNDTKHTWHRHFLPFCPSLFCFLHVCLVLIDVIITKSLTKDGDKMYTLEHKMPFKLKADTDVIAKVATAIMNTDDSIDTLKKK